MDVIARCAFGLKIDTLDNKDDPFIKNAQFIFNPPSSKTALSVLNCKSLARLSFRILLCKSFHL